VQSSERPAGVPPTAQSTFSVMTRLWAIAVLTIAVVVACERVPLTSPTGSTITLSVDRDTLPINGQATITAVVLETSGTPVHNGTTVTFQTSLGRTEPVEAQTVNGKAVVTFLAGSTSGTAIVNAFSGGARTGTTSGNSSSGSGVSIKIGTAAAERVSVRTEPLNVPVTGGTVTVVAGIFDASGNPITNTPVAFSADFGSLSSNTAITDANGEARVSLTTNRTTKITVTAGTKTGEFTLGALSPPTVTISCGTSGNNSATVGVPVSCTIRPTAGQSGPGNSSSTAPIQNVTVNWGDGTGEQPLGAVASGTDSVVQHTYSQPGTYSVTASATDVNSQRGSTTISIVVSRSTPSGFTLACPTSPQNAGSPGSFTFTPATNPTIAVSNVTVDFGDGSSRNLGAPTAPQSFLKTYSDPGGYTATATVTDITGQRGTATCTVVVNRSQPTVTITQPSPPANVNVPEQFTVQASASSGAPPITNVTVTRRDTGEVIYNGGSGGTFVYTFSATGTYVLDARAVDSTGSVATSSLPVRVDP